MFIVEKKEAYIGCFCSALYVVDLAKFRETAAGDQLRVVYETLSKDPNSLSNLDQVSERVSFGCFISVLLQTSRLFDCMLVFKCFRYHN